jgi:hypothetical protein
LTQLAKVLSGEVHAAEVAAATVSTPSVGYIRLARIEAHVVHFGLPVEVVRRPAAHVENPLAGLQRRLVEAAVADPVGADALL